MRKSEWGFNDLERAAGSYRSSSLERSQKNGNGKDPQTKVKQQAHMLHARLQQALTQHHSKMLSLPRFIPSERDEQVEGERNQQAP
mmetsp:Transcript_28681/g.56167  ORF Transcript_28681/g.56167 Transcript_28681/m.56167 type:complete len:86 (+) Transcript_28681:171-428(+)